MDKFLNELNPLINIKEDNISLLFNEVNIINKNIDNIIYEINKNEEINTNAINNYIKLKSLKRIIVKRCNDIENYIDKLDRNIPIYSNFTNI